MLRADCLAVVRQVEAIVEGCGKILGSLVDIWLEADQRAECVGDGGVEVEEVVPRPLEEGVEVISIILEEWALAVGRTERTPVDPSPVAMVADAHLLHSCLVESSVSGLLYGDG